MPELKFTVPSDSIPPVEFYGEEYRIHTSMLHKKKKGYLTQRSICFLSIFVTCLYYLPIVMFIKIIGIISAAIFCGIPLIHFIFGKKISAITASILIPKVMGSFDRKFRSVRSELLKGLSGEVLDVGSGSGEYLKYIFASEKVESVIALEPNKNLHKILKTKIKNLQKGRKLSASVVDEFLDAHLKKVGPEKYDWIILGNVLCEIPDVANALQDLDTLLKKNGRVYFSEHRSRWDFDGFNPGSH